MRVQFWGASDDCIIVDGAPMDNGPDEGSAKGEFAGSGGVFEIRGAASVCENCGRPLPPTVLALVHAFYKNGLWIFAPSMTMEDCPWPSGWTVIFGHHPDPSYAHSQLLTVDTDGQDVTVFMRGIEED